jgi:hypothetical protein
MRPESASATAGQPLVLRFADLFDHLDTLELRYSASAKELSGRDVAIDGYLSRAHGPQARWSLVDQPGTCPDCSPVPAIALPGAQAPMRAGDDGPVRVHGRLDFGLRIDDGVASMLRIERASVMTVADAT